MSDLTQPDLSADRLYINVPREQKDAAKALGARWDAIAASWFNPETNKKSDALLSAFPVSTNQDLEAAKANRREFVNVPREQKDAAKELGAKWDGQMASWYSPKDNPNHAALLKDFPLQTDAQLYEIQAQRIAAKAAEKETAKDAGPDVAESQKSGFIERSIDTVKEMVRGESKEERAIQNLEASMEGGFIDRDWYDERLSPPWYDGNGWGSYEKGIYSEVSHLPERDYINVSKEREEAAKTLGAKWDSIAHSWYSPEGNSKSEDLASAFSKATVIDLIVARQDRTSEFIKVPQAQEKQAQELGAKWDKDVGCWYIERDPQESLKGNDAKLFEMFAGEMSSDIPNTKELYEIQDQYKSAGPERSEREVSVPEKFAPEVSADRAYINVPREEKDEAKELGAKWDGKAVSWYIPEGNANTEVLLDKWPAQTQDNLATLKASRDAAKVAQKEAPKPEHAFGDFLRESGAKLAGEPVMDGKWHRVAIEGDKGATKSATYRGFADGLPNGLLDNKKTGEQHKWTAQGMSKDQVQSRPQNQSQSKAAETDLAASRAAAAKKAFGVWKNTEKWATPETSAYLASKEVKGHFIKVDGQGKTLIPLRDAKGSIHSLQIINETGKTFMKGGAIKGMMHLIDPNKEIKDGASIAVAEGYATAASVHEATKLPVAVAFNATNLKAVALSLKETYPEAKLIIAADNDHKLEGGKTGNVGLEKGREAARAVDGRVMAPSFTKPEMQRGLTDWNDMQKARGVGETREAMQTSLRAATAEKRVENSKRVVEATRGRSSGKAAVQAAGQNAGMGM